MLKDYDIVNEKVKTEYIGIDGNRHCHKEDYRYVLKNEYGDVISHQYYGIQPLGDDHYAVCDLVSDIRLFSDYNHDKNKANDYENTTVKAKWGVVKFLKDKMDRFIPYSEVMVVPYLYDKIIPNNLSTAIVSNDGKFTYLDLDENGKNYGKQIVPCVLDYAEDFITPIHGFTKCILDGKVGYLPRDCKPLNSIQSSDLLTEQDVLNIMRYTYDIGNILDSSTNEAFAKLTGLVLCDEEKVLKKK